MVILTVCNNILQRVKAVVSYNALSMEAVILSILIPEERSVLLLKEI
jgi:hypothetical protein